MMARTLSGESEDLGINRALVTVRLQGNPSGASCLWSSSLEAEPTTEIWVPVTYGRIALRHRECGKQDDKEVAKPGCVSGKDLGLIHGCSGCNSLHGIVLSGARGQALHPA